MYTKSCHLFALMVSMSLCLVPMFPGTSLAQGSDTVEELHALTSGRGKMVVAVSRNGVTFVDAKAGLPFRAFRSTRTAVKGSKPDWFLIRDVDKNGTIDVVGVGKPAFIVEANGAPLYSIPAGCPQFHLADFDADNAADILCRNGDNIELRTYNGQKLWQYKVMGLNLGVCNFGDMNGDLKADIECEVLRKGAYLRISGDGTELGRDFASAQLSAPEDDNPRNAERMANYLKGNETFDLNGDGTAEEWVRLEGTVLLVASKSKPKGYARHEVGRAFSVLVDDVDDDGKQEIVVGGAGKVFIIDHEGKLAHTVTVDPKKLKRQTDVKVESVNANALEDTSEAAVRGALEKNLGKFTACYSGKVKSNPFTRVGRAIHSLSVNKKGGVTKVERLHSYLEDRNVDSCLAKALKTVKFTAGKAADSSVTVTLEFGFVDR